MNSNADLGKWICELEGAIETTNRQCENPNIVVSYIRATILTVHSPTNVLTFRTSA